MAKVLTVVNNSAAVSRGLFSPRFTMSLKGLDTRAKTLNLESAQFELHFENVDSTSNKLYVLTTVDGKARQEEMSLLTGTYSDIEDLITVINETFKISSTCRHRIQVLATYESS